MSWLNFIIIVLVGLVTCGCAGRFTNLDGTGPPSVSSALRTVVDDGVATGSPARAACQVARAQGAARVVLAVPVAPPGWEAGFAGEADDLVCVDTPEWFFAIGQFYADFAQVSDDEVIACLERAATPVPPRARQYGACG